MNRMWKKILEPRILNRIYRERLTEPLIANLVSIFAALFGSTQQKIAYDLIPRQPYAFGINDAFNIAQQEGVKHLILVEAGVASGSGFQNMIYIANKLSKEYKISFSVAGFDTGEGMPKPLDFRDHPEKYFTGDFVPIDLDKLLKNLPPNAKIYLGDLVKTIPKFLETLKPEDTIGFISVDVDYYSSTKSLFPLFEASNRNLMSRVPVYLDDVNNPDHTEDCGELLAIKEFNELTSFNRKIRKMTQLRDWRIFKSALWLDQMYYLHVYDHYRRTPNYWSKVNRMPVQLSNPNLKDS